MLVVYRDFAKLGRQAWVRAFWSVEKVMTKASKVLATTYARLIKKEMKKTKSTKKSKKVVADKANNGQVAVAA